MSSRRTTIDGWKVSAPVAKSTFKYYTTLHKSSARGKRRMYNNDNNKNDYEIRRMKMRKKNERKIDNIKCELDELAKMRMTHGDAIKAKNIHVFSIIQYSILYLVCYC